MHYRLLLLGVWAMLGLGSCQPATFNGSQPLPNGVWAQPVRFTANIADSAAVYDLRVSIRFAAQIRESAISATLKLTSPSGEVTEHPVQIVLRDPQSGKFMGEVLGDIGDVEVLALSRFKFAEAGNYALELAHTMPSPQIGPVMELGIKIVRAD